MSAVLHRICLPTLLLVFGLALPALASAGKFDSDVAKLLVEQGLQGAVWVTVDADGAATVGAAGTRNARDGTSMRPDDRVQVGSVAKTMLAVGIHRLVSQGRLSLDTPVSALLPDVKFDNPWAGDAPVRLRHLLDHTAGLDDARLSQVFSLQAGPGTPLADGFAGQDRLRVRSRPGARVSYSNSGYVLLGQVIEKVTGERYEGYLDAHLLRPLGMHDSSFAFVTQAGEARLAMGHFENGITQAAVPTYLRPAGQFTTTVADMATFARFLMGDGRIDGKPFIDAGLLHAMGRPNGTEAANAGLQVGYALGLATRNRYGALGKCHGGSTVGYRAMLCIFPERRKAYFFALNADSETANHGSFDELMVKALSLRPPVTEPTPTVAFDTSQWEGYYIPAPNRFASMAWLDTVTNFARLHKVGPKLRFTPFQAPEVELAHVNGALFRAHGRVSASHVLLTASTGERVISTGTQSYEKVSPLKLAPLWGSLLLGLLGLAYILVSGLIRISLRRISMSHPLLVPFVGVVALLLPLPLFYRQSFLQLGELTLAGGTLALVTGVLPVTMLAGLARGVRTWRDNLLDLAAMLGVLQLTVVLAAWGLLPLRLWA